LFILKKLSFIIVMLSFPTNIPAERQSGGVCQGTLTLHSKPAALSGAFCYAVLQSNALNVYESIATHERGDFPLYIWFIVGASKVSKETTVLRLMTNQGTQVDGTAPTERCRDIWVHALQSGLELSLQHGYLQPVHNALNPPEPPRQGKPARQIMLGFRNSTTSIKYCKSCGTTDAAKLPPSLGPLTPLCQFAKSEGRQDVCIDCSISQGLWYHLQGLVALYSAYDNEKCSHNAARDGCRSVAAAATGNNNDQHHSSVEPPPPPPPPIEPAGAAETAESWVNVPSTTATTPAATTILMEYVQSTEFLSYCAKSPVLSVHRDALMQGDIAMSEFLERLDEVASGRRNNIQVELKKQAFQMAGADMGTAMKLLMEQAFSSDESTDVLQCVLEFLLNLCDEWSDLQSVAFFWQQLCQIHLRMLPATNAVAASRVDLFEDFLLTICVNYSIHLALEIVWSHTADLEDSMQMSSSGSSSSEVETCAAIPRRRRFSVLRFLCELESLLFDFDGGWGGGSVAVGKLLKPTPHQVQLLKTSATQLRQLRPRSVLRRRGGLLSPHDAHEAEARRKYTIARNADYFTCHLNFSKRLSEIAEKLRLMEVPERSPALEQELTLLNSSGAMGGDPLNRVRKSLIRVVRLPATEGHVFRSKERTPVLLLMEVINEEIVDKEDADALAFSSNETTADITSGTSDANIAPLAKKVEAETESTLEASATLTHDTLLQVDNPAVKVVESDDSERGEDNPLNSSPSSMILEGAEEGYMAGSPGRKYATH
jgi:hypothetical protein